MPSRSSYIVPWPASKRKISLAGDRVRAWWNDPDPRPLIDQLNDDPELQEALALVYEFRLGFQRPLNKVTMGVRSMVSSEGAPVVVAQRLKRLPTIVRKLARFEKMELARMQDIGGCRAIVPSAEHAGGVFRRIKKNWDVKRIDDYVSEPKPTGYRAIHAVVLREGRLIEIQLRTPVEQRWAAEVDRAGGQLHVSLKDGEGPWELVNGYRVLAHEIADRGDEIDLEELDDAFDLLRARVRDHSPNH